MNGGQLASDLNSRHLAGRLPRAYTARCQSLRLPASATAVKQHAHTKQVGKCMQKSDVVVVLQHPDSWTSAPSARRMCMQLTCVHAPPGAATAARSPGRGAGPQAAALQRTDGRAAGCRKQWSAAAAVMARGPECSGRLQTVVQRRVARDCEHSLRAFSASILSREDETPAEC